MFKSFSRKLWDNMEKYGTAGPVTDDNIVLRMCIACRITKAPNTYSEYVILIAFPLQQWLHERASVLLYTFIASLTVSKCVWAHQPRHLGHPIGRGKRDSSKDMWTGSTNETSFRVFCVKSKLRKRKARYLPFHIHEIMARRLFNKRREKIFNL
jgi:hypothetical protein